MRQPWRRQYERSRVGGLRRLEEREAYHYYRLERYYYSA
jgi:hypothetical protein